MGRQNSLFLEAKVVNMELPLGVVNTLLGRIYPKFLSSGFGLGFVLGFFFFHLLVLFYALSI